MTLLNKSWGFHNSSERWGLSVRDLGWFAGLGNMRPQSGELEVGLLSTLRNFIWYPLTSPPLTHQILSNTVLLQASIITRNCENNGQSSLDELYSPLWINYTVALNETSFRISKELSAFSQENRGFNPENLISVITALCSSILLSVNQVKIICEILNERFYILFRSKKCHNNRTSYKYQMERFSPRNILSKS